MTKLQELQNQLKEFEAQAKELENRQNQNREDMIKLGIELKELYKKEFGKTDNTSKAVDKRKKIDSLKVRNEDIQGQLEAVEEVKEERLQEIKNETIEERSKALIESNKQVEALELEIFESKLKFLKELENAIEKRNKLQEIENEYHKTLKAFDSKDKVQKVKEFTMYNPDYLIIGESSTPPVAPTDKEIHKIVNGGNSAIRLPFSYLLFKKHGIVERNEKEAQSKLHEKDRGGK
ncbi:hypothetical protein ACM26V_09265 [Salipaludibacillus sp. HK11]|uniref:hypothetical protein n=1 Tax=Salipaludibacillus sp. HK11 TaxID=3394320 RepID=UPI0039FBC964